MRASERRYIQEDQRRQQWQQPQEYEEHERGLIERVSDEIRSWFGQDERGRRHFDYERPEFDERRGGEYMSQGEEFVGPGFRSRASGYQGFGQQPYHEYGSSSSGMGQYGSQSHRQGGQFGGMMGQRMGGGQFGGGRGGFGFQGGRYYQQQHEDFPHSREMYGGQGHGGQGMGGYGGQGLGGYGGQGMGGQGMGGYGMGGYGGQGLGGRNIGGQVYGGQMEERGRFAGRAPKGYRRSDERVMEEVCEVLTRNPHVDASNIEVKVQQGKVILSGTVEDRDTKRLVEDLSEDVSGVREVQNQLRVSRSSGLGMEEQQSGRTAGEQQTSGTSPTTGRGREV